VKKDYPPLTPRSLAPGATFRQPAALTPPRVNLDSPAADVMTDLSYIPAVTVDTQSAVDAAEQRMIARGVRLLLVVDPEDRVLGLVTASDILGEKPMKVLRAQGGTRRDVLVRDIMTPRERLEVLTMAQVGTAAVGSLVATLRRSGRQHALVVEDSEGGAEQVRGIFSVTQIARQLGIAIQTPEVARTFAEIERLLSG
jgi:CBS-domain-containing membrane protein